MTSRTTANLGAWQPIETAPRDGRHFLAFWPKMWVVPHGPNPTAAWGQCIVKWGGFDDDWGWYNLSGESESGEDPTHWMPLPEPPEDEPDGSS